jgi:hypothetical protein
MAGVEAEVRHDRHRDAGHAAVQDREREQLVAVDDRAGAVDGEHAVAVAVEREADVVAVDARRERVDVGRADAVVDVAPVGLVGDDGDVGVQAAEDLGRDVGGRAVGAVEQDLAAAEVERGEALVQAAQVVLLRAVQRRTRPIGPPVAPGSSSRRSMAGLGLVAELEAVGAEELDAVVAVRVVRRRDDRGEVEPVPWRSAAAQPGWAARRRAAPRRRPALTPAASAASSMSPDSRVSRMTSTRGCSPPISAVTARPSASARSAVRTSPATPRTPSVPNSLRAKLRR